MQRLCIPSNLPDDASPQLRKLLPILKILILLQLVGTMQPLACLAIVSDMWQGLMNFVAALLLFLVVVVRNWCVCVGYVVLALSNTLKCIVMVGTYFALTHSLSSWFSIVVYLSLLQVPYSTLAIHYVFETYKELKCEQ